MINSVQAESTALQLASLLYLLFVVLATSARLRQRLYPWLVALSLLALVIHSFSIAIRWNRVDHGPFINLYEILTSNVWSNMLGISLFFLLFRRQADIFRFIMPVMLIMIAWLLVSPSHDTFLPPTYNTVWLYFHVVSGKLFFTLLFLASGLAAQALWLTYRRGENAEVQGYSTLGYRFLAFAFVLESFMLFFGAIWAQDAWGRYWSWDPLETWAFVTWLAVLFTLHLQVEAKRGRLFLWLIPLCFVLAFLTFYGVPFVSTAPHKGMI